MFRTLFKIPFDLYEGMIIELGDSNIKVKVTKIKSVKFIDMRTIEVVGMCKNVSE